jgi:NAD-dependent DNA ligase
VKRKRQKHYTTREMIVKDIDAAHRRITRLLKSAEVADAQADLFRDSEEAHQIEQLRDHAQSCRAKVKRLEKTRLPKLQRVLVAFETKALGLPGHEAPGVVLEKL